MVNEPDSRMPARLWYGLPVSYRLPVVVAAHAGLVASALLAAFLLAYNFTWRIVRSDGAYVWFTDLYLPLLAVALPIKLAVFAWTGQYRGSWRYVSLRDIFDVISACLVASFVFLLVYFVLENGWEYLFGVRLIDDAPSVRLRQSSVFFLDWSATIVFICAAKVLVRFYYEDIQPQREGEETRVLIVGAGDAGEAVARELPRIKRQRYRCVGFLDDQVPELFGRIHNVDIVGRTAQIREICQRLDVNEVMIALPTASPREIRQLVERCEGSGVRFRTIPAVADLIQDRVRVSQIRDVDITDLLGREQVELDVERIGEQLRGKRIMVTGAGGSIGSEMCRQIAAFGPGRLILVEQAENNLFEIDRELRNRYPDLSIVPCVADIVDRVRLEHIFATHRPTTVFHAAAHKHVPLMEVNPTEAVKNNIAGTRAVADVAMESGVETVVMISTDKAVNPTSIMGCTKRVAEMYVQSLTGKGPTQFITVRFGNVLGSSGSVVPIFRDQIARGGPVTVTHPDMKRYFMTIPEAAQLVLQAGTMGRGGEIYLLHMGEPVRIVDLARDMITLSGLRPGVDIDIVFTGTRPGEKLFEELSADGERVSSTSHPKIGIWNHREQNWPEVLRGIQRLTELAEANRPEEIIAELQALVPEYRPQRSSAHPTAPAPRDRAVTTSA